MLKAGMIPQEICGRFLVLLASVIKIAVITVCCRMDAAADAALSDT